MPKLAFRRPDPTVAPTPSAPPPVTPTAPVAPVTTEPARTTRSLSHYRARRAALSLVVVAIFGLWFYHTNAPSSTTSSGLDQTAPGSVADPSAAIQMVLTEAKSYLGAHGTFNGFDPVEPSGVLIGAAGPGMVVSVLSGSTCLYSGVLSGVTKPVLSDPTLSACTATLVASAKTALANRTASVLAHRTTLASTQNQVTDLLSTWSLATGNSLAGVPSDLRIAGAKVLSVSSTQAVVRINTGPRCEMLTVPATSNAPVASPC